MNPPGPTGLCFPTATKEASKHGGEVVHALVTHPLTGQQFWHAWVERGDRCYDDTNAKLTIEKFYKMFHPEEIRRYSDVEAMIYAMRTQHHGPWEPDETGPPPAPPRRRKRKTS